MRLSSDEHDPGYSAWKRAMQAPVPDTTVSIRVSLDGAVVNDVVTADEEAGMLIRCCRDIDGNYIVNRDRICTETLHGTVRIELVVRWDKQTLARA